MILIDNISSDPAFCLASEEYLMNRHSCEEILMIWCTDTSVVIGKNQNPFEEISPLLCEENGINVYRRLSGGGTVFHGPGNLNFSFIRPRSGDTGYEMFLKPVQSFLSDKGIPAEIYGNMILADGLKISGNAQAYSGSTVLHHGTLLFSADLELLRTVTGRKRDIIESKAIKSSPHPVGNISSFTGMSFQEFKDSLVSHIAGNSPERYSFTDEDTNEIEKIAGSKYRTWEWNWGRSPSFTLKSHSVELRSEKGRAVTCSVLGRESGSIRGLSLVYETIRNALSKEFGEAGLTAAEEIFR